MKSKHVYALPFEKSVTFLANSDPNVHYSYWKHSVDFVVDFGIPIVAPLDGEIWNVKDDSKEGGNNKKYAEWKYQNLITIKHSDNEFSQYVHIAHESALVKIGDKVKKGDRIAKGVGMTGWTTAPHLHMMVFHEVNTNKDKFESLQIRFDNKLKIIRSNKSYYLELSKSKNKSLRELQEKYNLK